MSLIFLIQMHVTGKHWSSSTKSVRFTCIVCGKYSPVWLNAMHSHKKVIKFNWLLLARYIVFLESLCCCSLTTVLTLQKWGLYCAVYSTQLGLINFVYVWPYSGFKMNGTWEVTIQDPTFQHSYFVFLSGVIQSCCTTSFTHSVISVNEI